MLLKNQLYAGHPSYSVTAFTTRLLMFVRAAYMKGVEHTGIHLKHPVWKQKYIDDYITQPILSKYTTIRSSSGVCTSIFPRKHKSISLASIARAWNVATLGLLNYWDELFVIGIHMQNSDLRFGIDTAFYFIRDYDCWVSLWILSF